MSNLESSSLAGSAPSEQEVDDALLAAIAAFVIIAGSESWAESLRWLRTALPGLLATARDGAREPVEWLVRHVEPSLRKPQSFKSREEAEGYARWYNKTPPFRAEVCAVIPLAAARSTGSVGNG